MYTYRRFTLLYSQKLTQHCKAMIVQKKIKKKLKKHAMHLEESLHE